MLGKSNTAPANEEKASINDGQKNILNAILRFEFQAIWNFGSEFESAESGLQGIKDPILALKAFSLMIKDDACNNVLLEDLQDNQLVGSISQIREILSHDAPEGPNLLNLTRFNDPNTEVTRKAVVNYIHAEITKRIKLTI